MPSMFRGPLLGGLIAIFTTFAAVASAAPVRLVRGTDASATPAEQTFLRDRFWRVRAFTAFDSRLPSSWVNQHAFGLDAADAAAHPEWRLKDGSKQPVYVGTRVAADVGNPAFRTWWIARAQAALATGYRGLFVDDVFMERRFTTVSGTMRNPIDPRTGSTMTEANWQKQMADFMVAVRAALPGAEIVHDVLWYKGDSGHVLRELQAASVVSLDKGFSDPLVATYGYASLAGWIERSQARGEPVVLDSTPTATTAAQWQYGLASLLLVSDGTSALANDRSTGPYWVGYDVDLGAPTGPRYQWQNVWRRDFERGYVVTNEPGRPPRTLTLPDGFLNLDGVAIATATLPAAGGAVFVAAPPAPAPTPEPVETPVPVAPVATPTPPRTATAPIITTSTSSTSARISSIARGARAPGVTRTSVHGSALRISGRVQSAIAGQVRLTIERRRRRRWAAVRRVVATVKRAGVYSTDMPRLPHGTYRVRGSFLGTGTSQPSRSAYGSFHA